MNKYYDFNGYARKTTKSLCWAIYTDPVSNTEITLVFNEEGQCLGVEKAEEVRTLLTIEYIPGYAEFSIRGAYNE